MPADLLGLFLDHANIGRILRCVGGLAPFAIAGWGGKGDLPCFYGVEVVSGLVAWGEGAVFVGVGGFGVDGAAAAVGGFIAGGLVEEGSAAVLLVGVVSPHRAGGALFEAEGGGGGGAQEVEIAEAGFGGVDGGAGERGPYGARGCRRGWAAEAHLGLTGP